MKLSRDLLFAGFIVCLTYLDFSCANPGNKQGSKAHILTEEEKFNLFLDSLKQSGSTEINTANEMSSQDFYIFFPGRKVNKQCHNLFPDQNYEYF